MRRLLRSSSLLILLASVGLAAFAPVARADINPLVNAWRQWMLVCDNVRRCEARSVTPGANATLSVIRDGGPSTPVTVRLAVQGRLQTRDLQVDGMASKVADLDWRPAPSAVEHAIWTLTGPDAVRAIALLRNAQTLSEGGHELSLQGMTASLLAMDSHQGRLDTASALIRTGDLEENRAWPASPQPVVRAVPLVGPPPEAQRMAAARASRLSDREWECPETPPVPRDMGFALTETQALVFLECERTPAGSRYLPLRVSHDENGPIEWLILTMVADAGYLSTRGLASPQVDADTGTLTVTDVANAEGQPDGRCGLQATWRFGGEHFELTRYAEQKACAGLPGDWPVWYRARAVAP